MEPNLPSQIRMCILKNTISGVSAFFIFVSIYGFRHNPRRGNCMKQDNEKNTNTAAAAAEPEIILFIKNEHKYTLMLLSVLREQLAEFDIGKTPDYNLMYDIMHYMANFPHKFNHPVKAKLIQAIVNKDPENNSELETLLAEKQQLVERNLEVINTLKALLKNDTILREEQLKIFCKNYVELLEAHIELESQTLFSRARKLLTDEELRDFEVQLHKDEDHPVANIMEGHYKELAKVMAQRLENWEDAANDFAMAEFVGMGAFLESIEPFTIGASKVGQVVKDYAVHTYQANYDCYKELLTEQQENKSDYIEKPLRCMKACYQEYIDSLKEIGDILKQTKVRVYEPYEARKEFFQPSKNEGKSKSRKQPAA